MRLAQRVVASLILTAALAAPVAIAAAPAAQGVGVQVRVYDRRHNDYHNWDDNENHAWGQYESDHHRRPREYSHSSRREQNNYWNWRHAHPDGDHR